MASVLIVDDAAFVRMSIKKMLEAHGHVVAGEAADGVEALKKYAELKPDLVILDITMPQMNGLEVLKRIQVLDSEAKVIVCSSIGQQAIFAQAIELGVKEFIVKPFQEEQLIAAIAKVVEK